MSTAHPSPRISATAAPPSADRDASPAAAGDTSLLEEHDTLQREPGTRPTCRPTSDAGLCAWCRRRIQEARADARFCSKRCRQTAWRARRGARIAAAGARPLRMAYADPPYPGFARKLYGQPEVDHAQLIASLVDQYDGWALSTSAAALRDVLPLCPATVRVCAWIKPIGACPATYGPHNTWEPLLVVPGRRLRPGKRDWLSAQPARGGGDLPGRKPLAFCTWVFGLLGLLPGDTLDDVFPGTGIVGRSWSEVSLGSVVDAGLGDTSPEASGDRREAITA